MIASLIGLPGSGKTTIGRSLARKLSLPFVDSDCVIEQRINCSIRDFFQDQGELRFRDIEESIIDELTSGQSSVLSTGGGSVLREQNRFRLRQRSAVVYLHCAPEYIYRHVKTDRSRPLLAVPDPLEKLRELYAVRDPLYRETAHHVVEMNWRSVPSLIDAIAKLVGP